MLIKSDGSPWRPLVHIEDISRAFVAVLDAPRELVHNAAFNVGRTEENYRVRDVAAIVENVFAGSEVTYADGASPDIRNYRVNCDKILSTLPAYQPRWTVRKASRSCTTRTSGTGSSSRTSSRAASCGSSTSASCRPRAPSTAPAPGRTRSVPCLAPRRHAPEAGAAAGSGLPLVRR